MLSKQKLFASCLFMLLAVSLHAVNLATYYSNANGKNGAELKTALYRIMGNPAVKSYSSLWDWYYDTDRMSDNKVVDRYSNIERYFTSRGAAISGMNKEHGIPQSWWGGGTTGIGADLHHVMPSDATANSNKSNYGMGVVTDVNPKTSNGCIKVGKGTAGNNGTVQLWEPADNWKGDFARIYFYIVTAYEEKSLVQQQGANSMMNNTYPKLQQWAYELYIKWSREDPVDDLERQRNETVYGIQGNRNPFIDFPGLERYIWGDHKTQPVDLVNYVSPDGGETQIDATARFAQDTRYLIVGDTCWQQVITNSNGQVTYQSSDAAVAEVNATTGEVTAKAVGRTTITAFVAATETYRTTSASYTVRVTGNGDDPYPADGDIYERLTERPVDWPGTYLIVYEGEGVALNGGLEEYDVANNIISVDIFQQQIAVTPETVAAEFVVAAMTDDKYSFRGASGKYMGHDSSKNSIAASDSPIANTLSIASGEANIVSNGGYGLRYNPQNGQKRFRFYKTGQEPVALYRRTTANGIEGLKTKGEGQREIYDLAGRKIVNGKSLNRKLNKGVYIVDGKKVYIK